MSQLLINKSVETKQSLDKDNNLVSTKTVSLAGTVVDEKTGNTIMNMRTTLRGDGATPETVVFGGSNTIIGYNNDGSPRISKATAETRDANLQKFRARAIKEQKALTKENGIDPSVVNNYGDEDKAKENN